MKHCVEMNMEGGNSVNNDINTYIRDTRGDITLPELMNIIIGFVPDRTHIACVNKRWFMHAMRYVSVLKFPHNIENAFKRGDSLSLKRSGKITMKHFPLACKYGMVDIVIGLAKLASGAMKNGLINVNYSKGTRDGFINICHNGNVDMMKLFYCDFTMDNFLNATASSGSMEALNYIRANFNPKEVTSADIKKMLSDDEISRIGEWLYVDKNRLTDYRVGAGGNVDIIKEFLADKPKGFSEVFDGAVANGKIEVVEYLINELNSDITDAEYMYIVENNERFLFNALWERSRTSKHRSRTFYELIGVARHDDIDYLLASAISGSNIDMVKKLVSAGAMLDEINAWCVGKCNKEVFDFLISQKMVILDNINTVLRDDRSDILSSVIEANNWSLLGEFIRRGLDLKSVLNSHYEYEIDFIKFLLGYGVDPDLVLKYTVDGNDCEGSELAIKHRAKCLDEALNKLFVDMPVYRDGVESHIACLIYYGAKPTKEHVFRMIESGFVEPINEINTVEWDINEAVAFTVECQDPNNPMFAVVKIQVVMKLIKLGAKIPSEQLTTLTDEFVKTTTELSLLTETQMRHLLEYIKSKLGQN